MSIPTHDSTGDESLPASASELELELQRVEAGVASPAVAKLHVARCLRDEGLIERAVSAYGNAAQLEALAGRTTAAIGVVEEGIATPHASLAQVVELRCRHADLLAEVGRHDAEDAWRRLLADVRATAPQLEAMVLVRTQGSLLAPDALERAAGLDDGGSGWRDVARLSLAARRGDLETALEIGPDLMRRARSNGDDHLQLLTLDRLAAASFGTDPATTVRLAEDAVALARELGDLRVWCGASLGLVSALAEVLQLDRAYVVAEHFLRETQLLGLRTRIPAARSEVAHVAVLVGDADRAERESRAAWESVQGLPDDVMTRLVAIVRSMVLMHAGAPAEEIEPFVVEIERASASTDHAATRALGPFNRALFLALYGRATEAVPLLDVATPDDPAAAVVLASLCATVAARGGGEAAVQLAERHCPSSGLERIPVARMNARRVAATAAAVRTGDVRPLRELAEAWAAVGNVYESGIDDVAADLLAAPGTLHEHDARILPARLRELPESVRAGLGVVLGPARRVADGTVLRTSEDPAPQVHLVVDGVVRIATGAEDGMTIRYAGSGDVLGAELLAGRGFEVHHVAEGPVVVRSADVARARQLHAQHQQVAEAVLESVSRTACEGLALAARVATWSVRARVCHELVQLDAHFGRTVPGGGRLLTRSLAVADLARRVGATRESVSRTMGQLDEMGVARRSGRSTVIVDPRRLVALATRRDGPA